MAKGEAGNQRAAQVGRVAIADDVTLRLDGFHGAR